MLTEAEAKALKNEILTIAPTYIEFSAQYRVAKQIAVRVAPKPILALIDKYTEPERYAMGRRAAAAIAAAGGVLAPDIIAAIGGGLTDVEDGDSRDADRGENC